MLENDPEYHGYVKLLKEELIPAAGCTEPAAVAYAAALAREQLGVIPDRVIVEVSSNIVKNVKSVVVPNTGGLKGIKAAAAAGIVAGISEKKLEVISAVSEKQREELREFLKNIPIETRLSDTELVLDIIVTVFNGSSSAKARISGFHTNVVLVEKDGKTVFSPVVKASQSGNELSGPEELSQSELSMEIKSIVDFAETVKLEEVEFIIDRQIAYNKEISEEGLKKDYGANIGKLFRKVYGDDLRTRAKAAAAAGSDARMGGCEMPVVIVSGSGNQGMAASLPVIEYAGEMHKSREELIRALLVSNLTAIHLKKGIGRLSAYCGVVCAGAAAGAGIAFLCGEKGGRLESVSQTIVNALASVSGIICDGAKPSCAAKIAAAVDAGILGFEMQNAGQRFCSGDGIVAGGVEETIRNVSRLGREGMKSTDKEIIRMMLEL